MFQEKLYFLCQVIVIFISTDWRLINWRGMNQFVEFGLLFKFVLGKFISQFRYLFLIILLCFDCFQNRFLVRLDRKLKLFKLFLILPCIKKRFFLKLPNSLEKFEHFSLYRFLFHLWETRRSDVLCFLDGKQRRSFWYVWHLNVNLYVWIFYWLLLFINFELVVWKRCVLIWW